MAHLNPTQSLTLATSLGELFLSKHAVDQFAMRSEAGLGGLPKNPRAALLRLMASGNNRFVRVELPAMVAVHKSLKYGSECISEYWLDQHSGLHLTIAKPVTGGPGTVVTVFFRTAQQRVA